MAAGLKGQECSFMDRMFPLIILAFLGLSAPAAAEEENPWLAEGRATSEMEACLAAAPEDEGNAGRDCSDLFFMQCAEAGGWTTLAMNFCQYELRDYWEGVATAREAEIVAREDARLTEWVEASAAAYEAHKNITCARFRIPQGTLYGMLLASCHSQMTRERADVLGDFVGEQPVIVPEPE
jgi:hypothetical protein